MTARDLLASLAASGVSVRIEGDALKLRPAAALDDELRAEIRSLKPAIIQLLSTPSETLQPVSADAQSTLAAFLQAVEAARHPERPGLVVMSTHLTGLWKAAEAEVGYPLDLAGRRRVCKPRSVVSGNNDHGATSETSA
jgi:hypothetical protein